MATASGAHLVEGRLVVEARFRRGDKQSVLKMLLGAGASATAVLYAGDDATDEGAYELVGSLPHGFAFHVRSGEYPSPAARVNAMVESPQAWVAVLDRLATTLSASRDRAA